MIFEINFFLFNFAQSCIWSYICVYAKFYANITNVQFGTLSMTFPVIALIAKPTVCSLADAYGIHRRLLIIGLVIFSFSYGSFGILPFFKDPEDHENDSLAWICICIPAITGGVSSACINCMTDALASNYCRKHNKSYGRMRIWANIGWASGALFFMCVGEITWLPFRVPGCIMLFILATVDITILILWPYQEDFEMFHDGSTVEQRKLSIVGPNTIALLAQNKHRGSISRDIMDRIKAGRSKSLGNLPRLDQPNLVRITISEDMRKVKEKVIEKELKEYSNFECQLILMKMIAKEHKSFIRYILLFTVFGMIQSTIYTYLFDFINDNVVRDNKEFEFISALCLIAQAIFGEAIINIFAADMVRLFGANANLSLAFVALGMRCFFYSNLLPYLGPLSIVFAEVLQGPSLGLYWVLIVEIGSNYALMVTDYMPELKRRGIVRDRVHEEELTGCLRATMIGVMSSSMEGLGIAIGSLLGGFISTKYGYMVTWNLCALVSTFVGFSNIGWDLLRKLC